MTPLRRFYYFLGMPILRGITQLLAMTYRVEALIGERNIEPFLDGKAVCVITVSEYPLKPVSTRGRCYRRVGNANSQMPPAEIAQMHMRATGTSWDALPATGKTVSDIDLNAVAAYIAASTRIGRRHFAANADPVDVLRKLELVKDDAATCGCDSPVWQTTSVAIDPGYSALRPFPAEDPHHG
jgi:hypothetical protein